MTVQPIELARALSRRERVRREAFERRAADLRVVLERSVRALARRGAIRRAWLIGSLARGTFGPRSDVDVVVEGLEPKAWAETWDELVVALGAAVDLLRLEELPERFRRRVELEGTPLDVA